MPKRLRDDIALLVNIAPAVIGGIVAKVKPISTAATGRQIAATPVATSVGFQLPVCDDLITEPIAPAPKHQSQLDQQRDLAARKSSMLRLFS